ncbi:MAG: nitroreductase family protein [Bacteroidales bacterium]|nr:nitroreductase family protein [Bacteroidales bacterium]
MSQENRNIAAIVRESRTCRRYKGAWLEPSVLESLMETARYTPSAANRQVLRLSAVVEPEACSALYPALRWAGYFNGSDERHPRWDGPCEEERPRGYIIIWHNISAGPMSETDMGIVAQTINLTARADMGLALCMIGAFDAEAVKRTVPHPEDWTPRLVLALGQPAETSVVEDVDEGADLRYWRDEQGGIHVPKVKR